MPTTPSSPGHPGHSFIAPCTRSSCGPTVSLPCILSKILLIQLQADQTPVKPSSKFIDLTADSEDDVDDIPVQSQDGDDARIIRTPSPPAFATTSNTVKSEKRVASKTRSGVRSSPRPVIRVRGASLLPHVRKNAAVRFNHYPLFRCRSSLISCVECCQERHVPLCACDSALQERQDVPHA